MGRSKASRVRAILAMINEGADCDYCGQQAEHVMGMRTRAGMRECI